MSEKKSENAATESATADSEQRLVRRLQRHIQIMDSHQLKRMTGKLLVEATAVIEELSKRHPDGSVAFSLQKLVEMTDSPNSELRHGGDE